MKQKILGFLLMGAFAIASMSTFVSCKDYDDDINGLRDQINKVNTTIDDLKASFVSGVAIKDVAKSGSSLVFTMSDGTTRTIENADGKDGKDAVVWTIGTDGFWYQDGVKTAYKAVGTDGVDGKDGAAGKDGVAGKDGAAGKDGVDGKDGADGKDADIWTPGTDGYWYKNGVITAQMWAPNGILSAAQAKKGVVLFGVDGSNEGVFIPTVASLTSLVFIPDHYYWGIEATTIKTLKTPWWDKLKALTNWIDDASNRQETVGQIMVSPFDVKEQGITDYKTAGSIADHGRYVLKNGANDSVTVLLNARARYHVNPSTADLDDASVSIIDFDKAYTRSSAAQVSVLGKASGSAKQWSVSDGILNVPLHINYTNLLGKIASLTSRSATDAVTSFATQVTFNDGEKDTTVTSDYAVICEEKVTNLRLSHRKFNPAGRNNTDFIQTGVFNLHCGDCSLPAVTHADGTSQPAYSNKGMHLFATWQEAYDYVTTATRIDGGGNHEGQDLVGYHDNLNLNKLVETHFTNESGQHDFFNEEDLNRNFYYRFYMTRFVIGANSTDESAHACILTDAEGTSYLHPLDPADNGGLIGRDPAEINNDLNDWSKTTEVVVNRVPLVRVELVSRADNKVVDYGYLPIRIVKENIVREEQYVYFDGYQTGDWSVDVINGCIYTVSGVGVETNWRNTEEDLFMLASKQLGSTYPVLDRQDFDSHYAPELVSGGVTMQQYLVDRSGSKPTFTPVLASPIERSSIGDIEWLQEVNEGTMTNRFRWSNITLAEIQALANVSSVRTNGLERAVKLYCASDPLNYPTIYVIFKSGAITKNETEVTGDMHLKEHIIPEYLFKQDKYSTLGSDEIHANTMTPEENDLTNRSIFNFIYNSSTGLLYDDFAADRNKANDPADAANAWKPAYLDDQFSDVFVGNFNGAANQPQNWITLNPANNTLLSMIRANQLDLDFVFDASNNGRVFYGYTDNSGNPKAIKISVSNDKKVLFGYINSLAIDGDTIAEIVVDGAGDDNKWNKNDGRLRRMRIDYKRQTRFGYAEALLNFKGSHELNDSTVKATVAVEAWANMTYNNPAIAGTSEYVCAMKLANNTFDVRFLRPISIDKSKSTEIIDAYSTSGAGSGSSSQVIEISKLKPSYLDWRELEWKTNPSYEQYYAQNTKSMIDFRLAGAFTNGVNISIDPNVKTTLGGNGIVSLASVSSQLDFTYYETYTDPVTGRVYNEPVLVYRNLSSTVGDFKVYIPVEIEYYWGKYYDTVTIDVHRTAGARKANH